MSNHNQLEQSLLKWLDDERIKTDIEFGEFSRKRISLVGVNRYDEESKKDIEDNINRLRFRYRWLEGQINQIKSFNKK